MRKLSPGYIRLYQIISQIGEMVYQLALLPSFSRLHDVFHVSQLGKFALNLFQPNLTDTVKVEIGLSFQPQPRRLVDYTVKALRKKVLCEESHPDEATWKWELELEMRDLYPYLFR